MLRDLVDALTHGGVEDIALVNTPEDALKILADHQPWAALVDWSLGGTSGLPATQQLTMAAQARGTDMPVYMIAAMGGEAVTQAALAVGAKGVILWPRDQASLVMRLRGGS